MTKQLQATSIRIAAQEVVSDIDLKANRSIGMVTDYQIIFCGSAKGLVSTTRATLEELSDEELKRLADWIMKDYIGGAESEWDIFSRYV